VNWGDLNQQVAESDSVWPIPRSSFPIWSPDVAVPRKAAAPRIFPAQLDGCSSGSCVLGGSMNPYTAPSRNPPASRWRSDAPSAPFGHTWSGTGCPFRRFSSRVRSRGPTHVTHVARLWRKSLRWRFAVRVVDEVHDQSRRCCTLAVLRSRFR